VGNAGTDARTCALSEVSIPALRFANAAQGDARGRLIAGKLIRPTEYAATMPDKGCFVELLPMVRTDNPEIWESCLDGFAASYYPGHGTSLPGLKL
jgi:hypothetical protein